MFMPQPEADRLVQQAVAEMNAGRSAAAAMLLDRALLADPHHPMALTKQAELAMTRKDPAAALRLTEAALAIEKNFAPAWRSRSSSLWVAGRHTEAIAAVRRAVHIQPHNPEFKIRLAQFTAWTGGGAETREILRRMLETEHPGSEYYAATVAMLGELAIAEGRFEDALPHLDRALQLEPRLETTRMLRGMTLLRLGRFREGWTDYAARETIPQLYPDVAATLADQVWRGQDLTGKTLLVTDDQGHGDSIQFFRYLPALLDRGTASVTWRTFPSLVRLLAGSAPYAEVLSTLPPGAWFDFETNSTNLPRAFETTLETIPAPVSYLRAPARRGAARKRPASRRSVGGRLKVGLVWSGDPLHTRDHLRSIPAALLLTLTAIPGVSFHSLQYQIRHADRPAVEAHPALVRDIETAADFGDTAGMVAGLDLVIAVDTAIAHLAGALGKPVWLILHAVPDWRWLVDRSDTPWYPDMRLFRVTQDESWLGWGPIVDRVAAALVELTGR
jgi:tetratricopeptide (TPR) repeat protein